MTTQSKDHSKGWKSAFTAFLDRRALIMLFLGFSSGIPIFLIFSTLSFWLTEAGISRSTITMFSWAALAYAFKFIWAPLIDKLPIPLLTKMMGQRRSWLLISQLLVICAICLMAMTNPDPNTMAFGSVSSLTFMAMAAVFLGFSSATQDIIVDAYRIELADDPDVQTVLASTYNAGYRIATIITQLGALLFAASLGTAVGNYIYQAWQTTYLVMAGLMIVGVITTFVIHEPVVKRQSDHYKSTQYLQLFLVFVVSTGIFVTAFIYLGQWLNLLAVEDAFLSFVIQVIRFAGSVLCAVAVVMLLVLTSLVDSKIVVDTWVAPFLDFFKRYGLKVALAILLLIGFYRISDIVAGVMANLFYLDLNFDKEEIAWFNKFFAIFFVILGGFLGGLLAQRYNVMKMMLLGAVLASSTNLIFVGLVKSGSTINDVQLSAGTRQYTVHPDEVGNWNIKVDAKDFAASPQLKIQAHPSDTDQAMALTVPVSVYHAGAQPQLIVRAIGGDDQLHQDELKKDVIVLGSLVNLPQQATVQKVQVSVQGAEAVDAKIENGSWSAVIPGAQLAQQDKISVQAEYQHAGQVQTLTQMHAYQNLSNKLQPKYRLSVADIPSVNIDQREQVELKGKVIVPYSKVWLVMGIIFDNLASGLAGAVFIAFLSSLTSVSFTAMQYAIFSSLMLLLPKMIGGYSGTIVTSFGYSNFFFITFLMGIPIFLLVLWVAKLLSDHKTP